MPDDCDYCGMAERSLARTEARLEIALSLLSALAVDLAKWDRECCGHALASEYRAWSERIREHLGSVPLS